MEDYGVDLCLGQEFFWTDVLERVGLVGDLGGLSSEIFGLRSYDDSWRSFESRSIRGVVMVVEDLYKSGTVVSWL